MTRVTLVVMDLGHRDLERVARHHSTCQPALVEAVVAAEAAAAEVEDAKMKEKTIILC